MISAVFAVALMAAAAEPAGPKAAPTGAAPASTPVKSEKPSKDGMVCKREPALGSRMKQRVCMSQAQWDQLKNDARDQVEKNQSVKPLTF